MTPTGGGNGGGQGGKLQGGGFGRLGIGTINAVGKLGIAGGPHPTPPHIGIGNIGMGNAGGGDGGRGGGGRGGGGGIGCTRQHIGLHAGAQAGEQVPPQKYLFPPVTADFFSP